MLMAKCGACGSKLADTHPVAITGAVLGQLGSRDGGRAIVDVWAPWCGPCRQFAPTFEDVASAFAGQVRFFKINADEQAAALQPYGIRGIPSLLAFDAGRLIAQQAGALSPAQLTKWIRDVLGVSPTPQDQRSHT